jgi:hypothetical protein
VDSKETHDDFVVSPCAAPAEAVEILSPLETGTTRRRLRGRGRDRETDVSHECTALAGGPAVPKRLGNWLMRRGAVGEAPSISYMEGALLYSARPTDFCQDRHAERVTNWLLPGGRRLTLYRPV